MRSLQTIISARAILPSVNALVYRELITDNTIINQIMNHPETTLLYASLLTAAIYTEYKYKPIETRYKIFDAYQTTKKTISTFLLLYTLIFFRNIENAI
jgi:hypothetical protein